MNEMDKKYFEPRKDRTIKLPGKFILTEIGEQYFHKKKVSLTGLLTTEGIKKPGFFSRDYHAESIQKLMVNSLLGEILIERPEFLTKRREIMDTTKLIIYAITYKLVRSEIEQHVYKDDIFDRWNKANPDKKIMRGQKLDANLTEQFYQKRKNSIEKIKDLIISNTNNMIDKDNELAPEIKIEKKRSLNKFVDQIGNDNWFLFITMFNAVEQGEAITKINEIMYHFIKKTQIADYFALMLMELVQNAEKAHFEIMTVQNNLSSKDEIDDFLQMPENRNKLIQIALKNKDLLFLSWKIQETLDSSRYRCKLQLILSNRGMVRGKIKKEMRDKIKIDTGKKSLADFYSEKSSSSGIALGAGLGLFYLSFIEKECKNENIHFEATVNTDPRTEETLIYLMLFF